jgi:hypothetical protein
MEKTPEERMKKLLLSFNSMAKERRQTGGRKNKSFDPDLRKTRPFPALSLLLVHFYFFLH